MSKFQKKDDDVIVLLGDVGANYTGTVRDAMLKSQMNKLGCTFFCIHGNHENRPQNIPTYKEKTWRGGRVLYEEEYPNLLFPIDGDIFDFDGYKCLVIGGAYSVDKFYRLLRNMKWWEDEQPSAETKKYVERQIAENKIDVIFSHTCPAKYTPIEMFLPFIDQSTVDDSTEQWLDTIEEKVDYKAWYLGHWHTDKHIDKLHFLFRTYEVLEL